MMRIGGLKMIGFYDYTVILTYVGFCSGMAGIFCASAKHVRLAVFFLALSGLCDMFDGKIARTKKNRTDDEKSFGIQIDSLSDMVCFGILPVMICFRLGMKSVFSRALLTLYATFLVILHILVAGIGTLFILNFKMRKLSVKELILLVMAVAASVAVIVFVWHSWWKLLHFYK